MAKFATNPDKQKIIQEILDTGVDKVDKNALAAKYDVSIRTVERYIEYIKNPKPQKLSRVKTEPINNPDDGDGQIELQGDSEPGSQDTPPPTKTEDKQKPVSTAAPKVVGGNNPMAAVAARTPAPIVFVMGDLRIDLNPADFYDAYRYYQDIRRIDPGIDDTFSFAVKLAMKTVWEKFSEFEAARVGVTFSKEVIQDDSAIKVGAVS
jgi:hypothetical protein